ncbi:MAG TPA: glutathione S-transferase family protein [Thermodesulfobacteriota bacterium]|nr:glutathione S-transferase family protein [Thermodesulfobacteriota bacterium]
MPLQLFTHPFASYCQKVLIALYENETPFTPRMLDQSSDPATFAEFEALWPLKKFPLLLGGGRAIAEATIIIEYLDIHYPGPRRMIPADPESALEVRFMDRFFDNYVHTPMQTIVFDALREPSARDAGGVDDARAMLDTAYGWLENRMTDREWAAGGGFGLADCAAAPALFYADWAYRISEGFPNVRAYRSRLNARPSFARVIEEARPYRQYFPLGAPDRD